MFEVTKIAKALALTALVSAAPALSMPLDFIYQGKNYGVLEAVVVSNSSIRVQFTANAVPGVSDFQVTGFGFAFANSYVSNGGITVSNPTNGYSNQDENSLNWIRLTNLNAIPQPANSNSIRKDDFKYGVTEGKANNINPPGIHPGDMDFFFLGGFRNLSQATDLDNVITLAGIRIQAIRPGDGSLFLAGTERPRPVPAVPEPSTIGLLAMGLLGLTYARRRKA